MHELENCLCQNVQAQKHGAKWWVPLETSDAVTSETKSQRRGPDLRSGSRSKVSAASRGNTGGSGRSTGRKTRLWLSRARSVEGGRKGGRCTGEGVPPLPDIATPSRPDPGSGIPAAEAEQGRLRAQAQFDASFRPHRACAKLAPPRCSHCGVPAADRSAKSSIFTCWWVVVASFSCRYPAVREGLAVHARRLR